MWSFPNMQLLYYCSACCNECVSCCFCLSDIVLFCVKDDLLNIKNKMKVGCRWNSVCVFTLSLLKVHYEVFTFISFVLNVQGRFQQRFFSPLLVWQACSSASLDTDSSNVVSSLTSLCGWRHLVICNNIRHITQDTGNWFIYIYIGIHVFFCTKH